MQRAQQMMPGGPNHGPVYVLNTNTERQTGKKAQMSNIEAAKTVADVIRTCLGPQAMLKMVMDPMGGIVLTNDGNAILREIEVVHPAAKSMLELCRAQDEEVGDGTTSVIILSGEMLACMSPFIEEGMHAITIIGALSRALKDAQAHLETISIPINMKDDKEVTRLISSSIGTKIADLWSGMICKMALTAVRTVWIDGTRPGERKEADIKQYAKVEKIPGGDIEDCRVLDGVMFNKDIVHSAMRRKIEKPRILLIDSPLEYKKGESQTNIEITKEADWNVALQMEEQQIKDMCERIIAVKPDVLISEKGISDLAQHYLVKANISAIRRVRKTDNNRIARACGATIVNRLEDLQESDIGLGCGLFSIEKFGDEYFTLLTGCAKAKACTILLRGPSKDILNEIDRNLQDAMAATRNIFFNSRLCPGGGATEMALAQHLRNQAKDIEGVDKWPYEAVADALEVIPRTLIQNCGADPVRLLTDLRAKHAGGADSGLEGEDKESCHLWAIDGINGTIHKQSKEDGIWEGFSVKSQTLKTAIESACMILRVDDIVAGISSKAAAGAGAVGQGQHN